MEKQKYDLVYWRYDGKQIGSLLVWEYIVDPLDCKCPMFVKNETEVNKHNKELERIERSDKIKVRGSNQWELPVGIDSYLTTHKKKYLNLNSCYMEFAKMFSPEKSVKERSFIAELLAVVLSSYFIREIWCLEEVLNAYPLKNISASLYATVRKCGSDDEPHNLRLLCQSLMVPTAKKKNKHFELHVPTALPDNGEEKILSSAWLKPKDYPGDYCWPAPYRDTAVMLDGRFFKKADMNDFLSINPWCTAVIYGNKFEHPRLGVELDGKGVLDQLDINWNIKKVNQLIKGYIDFFYTSFDKESRFFTDIWAETGKYLSDYIESLPKADRKIGDPERLKRRILLFALISFSDFLRTSCDVSLDEAQNFKRELLTALLPGCYLPKPEEQPQAVKYPRFDEIMKELISTENRNHFYPIAERGEVWPSEFSDGTKVWGYVRSYKVGRDTAKEINLVFFRDTLIDLVQEKYPQCGSFGEFLTSVRQSKPTYLHPTPNVRCKLVEGGETKSFTAVRLILSELPISPDVKEAFARVLNE